jgi:hypothetical protein
VELGDRDAVGRPVLGLSPRRMQVGVLTCYISRCRAILRRVVSNQPPLKPLHADDSLIRSKLDKYGKLSDRELIESLKPGRQGSLKVRPDGTIIDGHHRIRILRDRGVDVDSLQREIIPKESI